MKNILLLALLATIFSCSNTKNGKENKKWEHQVTVEEVIQTSAYTYLLVDENGADRWIAVASMDAKVNDVLFYNTGLEMVDFKSKELNRVFPNLLLVQVISDGKTDMPKRQHTKVVNTEKNTITTQNVSANTKSEGLVTLVDLFANKSKYNGKWITVKGKVVKFNPKIMGKNWVHITNANGEYDLTITTMNTVRLDDEVTFDGVIILNKDFGAGYKYDIIMENAVLK